jgi:hypothetical protein
VLGFRLAVGEEGVSLLGGQVVYALRDVEGIVQLNLDVYKATLSESRSRTRSGRPPRVSSSTSMTLIGGKLSP